MKSAAAALVVAAGLFVPCSSAAECSKLDEYAALAVAGYLDSWNNVRLAYQQFQQCDDGAIAEGYSEMVARLLVDRWSRLQELHRLTANDPQFEAFILRRINATLDPKDLKQLERLARLNCPRGSRALCRKLREHAEAAQKEL